MNVEHLAFRHHKHQPAAIWSLDDGHIVRFLVGKHPEWEGWSGQMDKLIDVQTERRAGGQTVTDLPVNLYDDLDQSINVIINQPLPPFLFSHEGIIHVNVTLKVETVLMLLIWITSVTIQPETKAKDFNSIAEAFSLVVVV